MDNPPDTTTPPLAEERGQSRRLARSTAVFSLATAVSRVLGLVREMVSAYYFGVSGLINAFTVAIQIPNLVRALVADAALSGAFVPVFSELLEKGEKQRAWRVASTLFWLTLLVLGGVTAVFILLAPLLMRPFGDPGGDFDLAGSVQVNHVARWNGSEWSTLGTGVNGGSIASISNGFCATDFLKIKSFCAGMPVRSRR